MVAKQIGIFLEQEKEKNTLDELSLPGMRQPPIYSKPDLEPQEARPI
jgi:hypothetical protein